MNTIFFVDTNYHGLIGAATLGFLFSIFIANNPSSLRMAVKSIRPQESTLILVSLILAFSSLSLSSLLFVALTLLLGLAYYSLAYLLPRLLLKRFLLPSLLILLFLPVIIIVTPDYLDLLGVFSEASSLASKVEIFRGSIDILSTPQFLLFGVGPQAFSEATGLQYHAHTFFGLLSESGISLTFYLLPFLAAFIIHPYSIFYLFPLVSVFLFSLFPLASFAYYLLLLFFLSNKNFYCSTFR